jgi:hypothetical protein
MRTDSFVQTAAFVATGPAHHLEELPLALLGWLDRQGL